MVNINGLSEPHKILLIQNFIRGPINYCCMKGKIDGVEKKIILFMDEHYGLLEQTRCDTFDSIDISHHMYNEIKNTNEELDFFLEITLDEIKSKQTNKRDIYIKELFEMFKSEFVVEKINETDYVRYSKSNPNVRLHFLDIRDSMDFDKIKSSYIQRILKEFEKLLKTTNIDEKKNIAQIILNYFDKIYVKLDKLTNDKNEIIKLSSKSKNISFNNIGFNDKQKYCINKAINKCTNIELKSNLIEFLENNYSNIMHNLNLVYNNNIKKVLRNIEEYDDDKIQQIYGRMEFVKEAIIDLYSLFVDCYLLRRVLDKDYIKTSVIYTGIQHSIHYIYFLHKYYNFEITKIHHMEKSCDEMKKLIMETHFVFEIYKYIMVDKKYSQCITYEQMFGGDSYIEYLKNKKKLFGSYPY